MKFYGVLVLLATLSAAYGLECYICAGVKPSACTNKQTCPTGFDRCASVESDGLVARTCAAASSCREPLTCCSTDLCNRNVNDTNDSVTTKAPVAGSAISTISIVLLLLVSSAITSVFL